MSNTATPAPERTLTLAQLRAFEYSPKTRAVRRSLAKAKRVAKETRAKVDAYLLPIFQRFEFYADGRRDGVRITDPDKLYQCTDEKLCAAYYAACDAEHRRQGYNLPKDHNPALVAENEVTKLENALLSLASTFFGFDFRAVHSIRERALALLSRGHQFTEEASHGPEIGSD